MGLSPVSMPYMFLSYSTVLVSKLKVVVIGFVMFFPNTSKSARALSND